MTVSVDLAPLFEPFRLGSLDLRNRVVMAPMTRWMSPGQMPGADVAAYYRRRAENGVALIVTEGTTINHPVASYSVRVPAFHGAALDGWRRIVGEVHEAGGKVVPQIWHVGAMRPPGGDHPNPEQMNASPSGLYKPGGKHVADPLSEGEIQAIIASYAEAAHAAKELGFDGVEVHGAHGYLIDQFLWSALNLREDGYGGDAVERTRFAVEVISAIREAVGPKFPVILRISQWKQQDYDARLAENPEALGAILRPLADAGVDIFHCSQRRWWEPEFDGSPMNLAGWVKQLSGRPTITVGSVGLSGALSVTNISEAAAGATDNLAPLCDRLKTGEFDLVAVGRALIGDPAWVRKVQAGQFDALESFNKAKLETLF